MKKITNLLMLLAIMLYASCEKPVETPNSLDVKPYYLEGVWQLAKWNGGALADETYVYLVIDRKYTFEIYNNTASMYPVLSTGIYELEYDWRVGDIIRGTYDFQMGTWTHEYVITDLYESSMTWTAKDDASEVQKFVRVAEVPAEILEAVRKQD